MEDIKKPKSKNSKSEVKIKIIKPIDKKVEVEIKIGGEIRILFE